MAQTIKLADYLFTRLKQLGIGAVHGVPGDYNLTLLDYVEPSGLLWVGNANELNAGYAADGYARIKGFGALITTFGVGELSAINAIACAFTERAALVHIVGTPPRRSQEARLDIHHTMLDGEYGHFSKMASHVVAAQVNLKDPVTAPEMIDLALRQCVAHSRPVYIEVPVDMVAEPVLAGSLQSPLTPLKIPHSPEFDTKTILDKIYAAERPIILVDGESRPLGLVDIAQTWIDKTGWPTFTNNFGRGLIDETSPNVYGTYQADFGDQQTKSFFDSADLVICFGPHYSSINTYNWTNTPKADITISFTQGGVRIGTEKSRHPSTKLVAQQLLDSLDFSRIKTYDSSEVDLPRPKGLSFSTVTSSEPIKQSHVWGLLSSFLRRGDFILGETGTPGYGVRKMPLPQHSRVFLPTTWLSIGYMLPASQGAALAQRELIASNKFHGIQNARTVLFIGDGSFQMTVQELATIIHHNLDVVIFLINNDGYTIERCIHGLNQRYNDISKWRYLQAPSMCGAPVETYTASARTYGELEKILGDPRLADGKGVRMVEIFMDRLDAPPGPLLSMMDKQRNS